MSRKVVFILDGGFSEEAEIYDGFPVMPEGVMYVAWKSGQKASIRVADEGKLWKFI